MAIPAVELRYMFTQWIADGHKVLVEPGRKEWMVPSVEGKTRRDLLPEAEHYAQYLLAGTWPSGGATSRQHLLFWSLAARRNGLGIRVAQSGQVFQQCCGVHEVRCRETFR